MKPQYKPFNKQNFMASSQPDSFMLIVVCVVTLGQLQPELCDFLRITSVC